MFLQFKQNKKVKRIEKSASIDFINSNNIETAEDLENIENFIKFWKNIKLNILSGTTGNEKLCGPLPYLFFQPLHSSKTVNSELPGGHSLFS